MAGVSIQQQINPPVATANIQNFSDATVSNELEVQNGKDKSKTDFRTLITNSMDEVKKERKAKENGDLSAASDEEFLQKLADQTKEKRKPKNELGKDDFLKLFVTQLQNQDPLNPDDGAEMAAKLAQFNGLEQMMNVNKGIEKLVAQQGSGRNLQMVNYIGKEVTVDGGRVRIKNGSPSKSEFSVESPVAAATLEVRDNNGILVSQTDLGAIDKGTHPIKWDGKNHDGRQVTDGVYTLAVTARNMDGENIPVNITSKARITGVDVKSEDGVLFSDFGKVTFDQIKSVGKPGYEADNHTPVTDDLDRMKAEGKLDLPQANQSKDVKSNNSAELSKVQDENPAGAVTPNINAPQASTQPQSPVVQSKEVPSPEPNESEKANTALSKKAIDPKTSPSGKMKEQDNSPLSS